MVSDGIDRLRGYNTPSGRSRRYQTMPSISPDADSASDVSQRSGVIIHTIYSPGIGRANRNYYEAQTGVSGITKLSDETGGESFYLSLQNPVSFKPYMDRLQTILDNQYFLVFLAKPNNKGGLQRVQLDTEVPSVELVAADNVWVPGIADSSSKNKK